MFADPETITKHIIDVINAAPEGTFSATIDTSDRGDKRRSDDAIASAQTIGSRKVIESVASNPSHSFWPNLMTQVEHGNDVPIKPHYGEIGIPYVRPVETVNLVEVPYQQGIPKTRGEIEGLIYSFQRNPSDFYGFDIDGDGNDGYSSTLDSEGRYPPNLTWYDTSNGVILFSGFACKIPMVRIPTADDVEGDSDGDIAAEVEYVRTHVPVAYTGVVAKYSLSLLVKEGDNLLPLANYLIQEAKSDLFEIAGGKVQMKPLDLNRAVELAQRMQ